MENRKNILVVAIGNLLFKDEGIGAHVIKKMKTMSLPDNVEVIDGGEGTVFPVLAYVIENRDKVVVIMAMQAGGSPGTIYRLSEKEFLETRKGLRMTQESEFEDTYRTTILMKTKPRELVVIGVEPEDMGENDLKLRIELTPTLEKKIPEIIGMVMNEIRTEEA